MRKLLLLVVTATSLAGVATPASASGPVPTASCNGVYSYSDAQNQLRDDVSHIVKEIAGDAGITVGAFFSDSAHQQPCG